MNIAIGVFAFIGLVETIAILLFAGVAIVAKRHVAKQKAAAEELVTELDVVLKAMGRK